MKRCLKVLLFLALAGIGSAAMAQSYEVGYQWQRQVDFQEGLVEGSTLNNPGADSRGAQVWWYWTTAGNGLVDGTPWYQAARNLMVWDVPTFNPSAGPKPRWSRAGGGTEPGVDAQTISFSRTLKPGGWPYQALVSWRNPAGNGLLIDIDGKAVVTWAGSGQTSVTDFQIELAVVKRSVLSGQHTPVLLASLRRPSELYAPNTWRMEIPLAYRSLRMDDGDELLVSLNNPAGYPVPQGTAWVTLGDKLRIKVAGYAP